MQQDNLPHGWALPERPFHTPSELRLHGRMSWFVRMAAKGLVPAPDAAYGVNSLVAACLPELFDNPHQVTKYRPHLRWDLLAPNGFLHRTKMTVSLTDLKRLVRVLVNAPTPRAAARLLRTVLPGGSEVEEAR